MEIGYLREPLLFHVMRSRTAPWGVVPGVALRGGAEADPRHTGGIAFLILFWNICVSSHCIRRKDWGEDDQGFPAECFFCEPALDKWR